MSTLKRLYLKPWKNRAVSVAPQKSAKENHMGKKTATVNTTTAGNTTTTAGNKVSNASLADKISALEAQAAGGDDVVGGAMGALVQLQANCEESKKAFKSDAKRLRQLVNALTK
jgi:hypothetical protein